MTDPAATGLQPATDDETELALSFALRFDGRKHHHRADALMARIVAAHLTKHMRQSGFVIMKAPPARHVPGGE